MSYDFISTRIRVNNLLSDLTQWLSNRLPPVAMNFTHCFDLDPSSSLVTRAAMLLKRRWHQVLIKLQHSLQQWWLHMPTLTTLHNYTDKGARETQQCHCCTTTPGYSTFRMCRSWMSMLQCEQRRYWHEANNYKTSQFTNAHCMLSCLCLSKLTSVEKHNIIL